MNIPTNRVLNCVLHRITYLTIRLSFDAHMYSKTICTHLLAPCYFPRDLVIGWHCFVLVAKLALIMGPYCKQIREIYHINSITKIYSYLKLLECCDIRVLQSL